MVPDSVLAGTPPRFDKAYAEIDSFRYIPFVGHKHESSTYTDEPSKDPYQLAEGEYATDEQYPTSNSHGIIKNYFPNGSFDFIKSGGLSSGNWYNTTYTGLTTNNATIARTDYDYQKQETSGGIKLVTGGYVIGYIDSVSKGQEYNLSLNYRYTSGNVVVRLFNEFDTMISQDEYPLATSDSWASFNQHIVVNQKAS